MFVCAFVCCLYVPDKRWFAWLIRNSGLVVFPVDRVSVRLGHRMMVGDVDMIVMLVILYVVVGYL